MRKKLNSKSVDALLHDIETSGVFKRKDPKAKIVKKKTSYSFSDNARRETQYIPSSDSKLHSTYRNDKLVAQAYTDEAMQVREDAAIAELKRKATMTAPIYNKGAYQYLGDIDPKDIGRKTSQLE